MFCGLACGWLAAASIAVAAEANPASGPAGPAPALTSANDFHVAIPRAGLGREYLLSGSLIPQFNAATSTGLAGKIVRFELFSDGVDLYESSAGMVVTDDLPARRLLTTFPIVSQDERQVVIDFNKGMRRVFTEIWYARGGFDAASAARVLELPQSRVFEVRSEGSLLVVRQSAQGRDRAVDPNREERYEIRYFIAPYAPPSLATKENLPSTARYVRFFESRPHLEPTTGRASAKIALFDVQQPILFYYSANTPDDYVEAVRDGILYWNRAFGKEVVQVAAAPVGVTAPDASRNLVQWVPWDNAGFAYADLLTDPRSGASQRGQAYITSVFAIANKARARQLLRTLRSTLEAKAEADKKGETKADSACCGEGHGRLGLAVLESASLCELDPLAYAEQLAAGLEGVLAEGTLDDQAVLRFSQDMVRQVVAHEVGHVLGLRHNFAGSLEATLSHRELDEWFRAYVTNATPELYGDRWSTTSIMEYTVPKASVFAGAAIRSGKAALPHDGHALRWGYFDSEEFREKQHLFGTDDQTATYGDLRTFDYGAEPVLTAYAEIADLIQNLPHSVIERFIAAKAPRDLRDRQSLAEVNLGVAAYAGQIAASLERMLNWFKANSRSLKVERAFDFVGDVNRKEIVAAHWTSLNDQMEKLGGIDRAVFAWVPVDLKLELKADPKDVPLADKLEAKKLKERLVKLLESPAYSAFVGLDDQTYSFTQEEKTLIASRAEKFFAELEKAVVKRICQVFERGGRDVGVEATGAVGEDDLVAKFEKRIIEFAREVITKTDDTQRRRGKVDKSLVEVVDFKYEQEARLAAARALGDALGSFKGWSVDAKGDLHKQLKDYVEGSLNIQNFKEFQESLLSRPLRDWYLNQQAVLALLPPKKPAAAAGAPPPK
jgi:hypothetical protein